jgi:hypothetical protein
LRLQWFHMIKPVVCILYHQVVRFLVSYRLHPLDLGFRCQKELLNYTRDVNFEHDHIIRCPHAGECTPDWYAKVDKNTKVENLGVLTGPRQVFCKLGRACAGAGCFFCTSSCNTIRYYPKPSMKCFIIQSGNLLDLFTFYGKNPHLVMRTQ